MIFIIHIIIPITIMSLLLPGLLTSTVFVAAVSGTIAVSVDVIGDRMLDAMDGISDARFSLSEKWDKLKMKLNRSAKRRKKIRIPPARDTK